MIQLFTHSPSLSWQERWACTTQVTLMLMTTRATIICTMTQISMKTLDMKALKMMVQESMNKVMRRCRRNMTMDQILTITLH
jgi:hypothetical protein